MSPKQKQILAFLQKQYRAGQVLPSTVEIAKHLSISKPAVHQHLRKLVAAGHLYRAGHGDYRLVNQTIKAAQLVEPDAIKQEAQLARMQTAILEELNLMRSTIVQLQRSLSVMHQAAA